MRSSLSERIFIDQLVPELQADGYEVIRDPRHDVLPRFLGSYSPDLIALRGDGNLAIEVAKRNDTAKERLEEITSLFQGRDDWKFKIYWLSGSEPNLKRQSPHEISNTITQIKALIVGGQLRAAFLLSWATFEAIGRNLLEAKFLQPQTPGRVIDVLAGEGILTPKDADHLRRYAQIRNKLIHGELDAEISVKEARQLLFILEDLQKYASSGDH